MASNFFNKASLVMVPDAPIDGKLPSVKPEDRSGDFTFSRGSNLAATRVNKGGLIEKGRENLLLQSNQFDTTWALGGASVTSGQAGYDGSNDAWLLEKSATNGRVFQNISQSGVQTFSVYAKSGTNNWAFLLVNGGGNPNQWYDLENGVLGNSSSTPVDSSITSVGNGWYKISITFNETISRVRIYVADSNNSNIGTSGSIYIQDAQLEQGLVATGYIETTTATVQKGILENLPRIDYSGGASCPSLLLEPQRTNLFTQSEYFSGSYWGKTGTGGANAPVVTQNYAVSPEGLQNASRVQFDTNGSTSSHRSGLVRDFAFTTGDKYAISCWVKATSGNSEIFTFRIAGQQVGGEKTATNEWQLFTETYIATATTTDNFGMQIRGNYSSQTSDILIYGMQLESAVSYPTSYIPAYGSSVTRSLDDAQTTPADTIDTQSFTLFFEHKALGSSGTDWIYRLDINGTSDNISFYVNSSVSLNVYLGNANGGYIFGSSLNDGFTIGSNSKVALSYDGNRLAYFINGGLYDSATGVSFNDANNKLIIRGVKNIINKQTIAFPKALTDDECIALTTI